MADMRDWVAAVPYREAADGDETAEAPEGSGEAAQTPLTGMV